MKTKEFTCRGHDCTLICPETPAPGMPWVWRAEFLYAFDFADKALLEKGWHIAYCALPNQYGCDWAVTEMKAFHDHLTAEYGLAQKADLFGFSRGGLYTFNYAVRYPEDMAVVYLDAPVLDIRSWPGGFGESTRCEREWEECKTCYGLTEETAKTFAGSPVDRLEALLQTGLPVILVAGDADDVVPYPENGGLLAAKMSEAGTDCLVVVKPGVWHHPHSLSDPAPIVDFILARHRQA